jgi:hypothetical protein
MEHVLLPIFGPGLLPAALGSGADLRSKLILFFPFCLLSVKQYVIMPAAPKAVWIRLCQVCVGQGDATQYTREHRSSMLPQSLTHSSYLMRGNCCERVALTYAYGHIG